MPIIVVQASVPTPGHRAPERHPAVVHVNVDSPIPHAFHPRVYANYVPAPSQGAARGTYRVPQRVKHPHPAPAPVPTTTVPCNCESAHCAHHGGQLVSPDGYPHSDPCPNPAGRYRMDYVGEVCDQCADVTLAIAPGLIYED